jgi:hypothetical protein
VATLCRLRQPHESTGGLAPQPTRAGRVLRSVTWARRSGKSPTESSRLESGQCAMPDFLPAQSVSSSGVRWTQWAMTQRSVSRPNESKMAESRWPG